MSKTDHTEVEPEIKFNGHKPGTGLFSEENTKVLIEKYKPYFMQLWEARWKIIKINAAAGVLTVLYLLFIAEPYYESSITILPEYGSKSSMLSQLGGLAAMAGMNIGEASPTEIYEDIIKSESVLKPVVYAKYKTEEYPDSVNLIQYFELDSGAGIVSKLFSLLKFSSDQSLSPAVKERKIFLKMYKDLYEKRVTINIDKLTKILNVAVEMPESKLSSDVANKIAEELDRYVRTQTKFNAKEQSFYLDKRVKQVFDSLSIAEEKLKNFREQNRIVEQSPKLMLEQARLMRTIEILQTVYGELIKQLEIAKVEEIKDAPIINIKEKTNEPIEKKGPKKFPLLLAIQIFAFSFTSFFIVFGSEINKYTKLLKLPVKSRES